MIGTPDERILLLADITDLLIVGMQIFMYVSCPVLIIFMLVVGPWCPQCKKRWALKRTGNTNRGWFESFREVKCKYCDYNRWESTSGGGGGGG